MGLIELAEVIKKKFKSNYAPGSVERLFEYNDMYARNESGMLPVFVVLDDVESKKKKSIN